MFKKLIILFLFFAVNIANASIPKILDIETTLSKNDFFNYVFTRVEFEPEVFFVNYNKDTGTYDPASTILHIETTVPKSDSSIEHKLTLGSNIITCSDVDNMNIVSPLVDNLLEIRVGDNADLFDENNPLRLEFNDVVENFKSAKHEFKLSFNALPSDAFMCQGEIAVLIEFDI